MPADLPDYTRLMSVNVEVNPFVVTVKEWNRDFELGDLSEWTAVDAEISEVDPYEGDYCCNLEDTDSSITQTLDDPIPVNAVYEFSAWFKRKASGDAVILQMNHTDGSVNQVGAALLTGEWFRFWFDRSEMRPDKILSGISIISESGDLFVDKVVLGIATEVLTGTVEVTQTTAESLQAELRPRPKGGVLEKGAETTTDTYATIASVTVTDDKEFQISRIVVSAELATWIKYRWDGDDISCEMLMDEKTIMIMHFPWDYEEMEGDGAKVFDVQAKYYEEAGIVNVEIVGEEV